MSVRTVASGGKQRVKNTGTEGVNLNVLTLDFDGSQFSVVLDERFDGAIGDGDTSPGEERDMSQSVATAGQTLGEGERQC